MLEVGKKTTTQRFVFFNKRNEVVSSCRHRNKALLRNN